MRATEKFCSDRGSLSRQNYPIANKKGLTPENRCITSVVMFQQISYLFLIQLLNPYNQKTMNKLKLLQFHCNFATNQQPLYDKTIAIPLQRYNRFATTMTRWKICHFNSIAISLLIRNSIATNILFLNLTLLQQNLRCKIHCDCFFQLSLIFVKFVNFKNSYTNFKISYTNFKISYTIIKNATQIFLIADSL